MRWRKWLLVPLLALLGVGSGGAAYALFGTESEAAPAEASIEDWRWSPQAAPPPEPEREEPVDRPREERPARTQEPDAEQEPETVEEPPAPPPEPPPLPDPSGDDAITKAEVLDNGVALPPLESPPEIRAIIEAGNTIARSPYKWGGGHGKWQDNGYDCSG